MADSIVEEERSRAARARAERALCTLAAHIADDEVPLIVLGGLMPEILTRGRETGPQHLGTSDVDLLLVAHLEHAEGFARIEAALEAAGFRAGRGDNGWRWRGSVDGFPVRWPTRDGTAAGRRRRDDDGAAAGRYDALMSPRCSA